jgi:hypothetical protein
VEQQNDHHHRRLLQADPYGSFTCKLASLKLFPPFTPSPSLKNNSILLPCRSFLRQWSNKTLIIAGDSLGRNFYGSFMCKLAAGGPLEYKDAETKAAGFQIFRNEEHNITFGRAMSEFLVLKETSQEAFSRLNQVLNAKLVASKAAVCD